MLNSKKTMFEAMELFQQVLLASRCDIEHRRSQCILRHRRIKNQNEVFSFRFDLCLSTKS